jgi:hypothetical protein
MKGFRRHADFVVFVVTLAIFGALPDVRETLQTAIVSSNSGDALTEWINVTSLDAWLIWKSGRS